jgi:hypothetical protein
MLIRMTVCLQTQCRIAPASGRLGLSSDTARLLESVNDFTRSYQLVLLNRSLLAVSINWIYYSVLHFDTLT